MSTINIDLAADTILNVMIGQQDENEVREVVFDYSDWYTTYGSGTISLAIQRPKDEWPYEGTLTDDSTNHEATWEISDTDTAYAGTGQIQLSYTVGDAKKKSVVYRFTCHKSLGALGSVVTPVQIQTFIDEVEEALQTMDGKLDDMEDEITDVKQDIEDLQAEIEGGGSGITADLKAALDQLAQKVAYIDEDGQDYYDALHAALYPPANLTRISCVYTQSGSVYTTDTLDSLKADLVVTAHYNNGTTQTVTTYALSGSLTVGTSTITISYGGKTTTFDVTVTLLVPAGYTAYDYIEQTKAITGTYSPSSNMIHLKTYANLNRISVELPVKVTELRVGIGIIGGRTASGYASSFALYAEDNVNTGNLGFHVHGHETDQIIPLNIGVLHNVKYIATTETPSIIDVDDIQYQMPWANDNVINTALTLLTNSTNKGSANLSDKIQVGIVEIKDISGNVINRYVPCIRDADNVIGVWDNVEEIFYTASATEVVTVGNASCRYTVGNWS